ncbi:MAG TPA: CopG family transcriptional regulator, partial [Cyanobacteria bacterium UBA11372]|nr:CopG family transcriptional regulator [Cyanobacteria bacterium UBA11372]
MTKKKDGSQFDDLFGAVKGDAEDVSQPTEKKQAKGNNPDYVRSTFYLSKQIHRQLKKAAIDEEREMSEIIEELVDRWL